MCGTLIAAALMAAILKPGAEWANDTVYTADRKVYEIRAAETTPVNDVRYHHAGYASTLKTAFFLKGLKNVTLDFGGATVLLHGVYQPFVLDSCTNVTVKNVTVKYVRSPFTEGRVVAKDKFALKLKVDKAVFPYETKNGGCWFKGNGWSGPGLTGPNFMHFFGGETRIGRGHQLIAIGRKVNIDPKLPWARNVWTLEASEEDGMLVLTSKRPIDGWTAQIGDRAVMTHAGRSISNCMMVDCRDTSLVNYRILNGFGMGIYPFHCHNIVLDGLRLTCDAESPSTASNSADGIHAFACSGDFIVRNSVIEGTVDDALNVHANFFKVKSVQGDKLLADIGLEPFSTTQLYLPGDRIRVYRGFTLEAVADYTIVATRPIDKKTIEFTLDRPAEGHQADDAIENLSTQCHLVLSNCRFGKSNTHLRFQTRGGILVENCESEMLFMCTGDMSYWFESSPCDKAVFRNVRFKTSRGKVWIDPQFVPTEKVPYYHGDLVFENCSFEATDAIGARHVKSLTLKNCTAAKGGKLKLDLVNCGKVDAPDCEFSQRIETPKKMRVN